MTGDSKLSSYTRLLDVVGVIMAVAALGLVAGIVRRPVAAPIQRALVAAVVLTLLGCWYAAAGR